MLRRKIDVHASAIWCILVQESLEYVILAETEAVYRVSRSNRL